MEWFQHKSNASSDAKIKKLLIRHGAEGYAVYFHCLELIVGNVNSNNITFQLEHDAEIIADTLRIKGEGHVSAVEKVEGIMRCIIDLELFEESDGFVTCLKVARTLTQSMTSNAKMRSLIGSIKQEHHDGIMTGSCKKRLDKTRQDNIIQDNTTQNEFALNASIPKIETCYTFEQFWNKYAKKIDSKKCKDKYAKIKESDRALIKENIKAYVESEPDKTFRKNPLTWLNGECWNDENIEKPQMNFNNNKHEQVGQLLRTNEPVRIAKRMINADGSEGF